LLLAKGCDRIAALTPGKQKTFYEAFGIHHSDSCLCLIRDVVLKRAQDGFGDSSWLTLVRASWKGIRER
jgi:hypothetical protein